MIYRAFNGFITQITITIVCVFSIEKWITNGARFIVKIEPNIEKHFLPQIIGSALRYSGNFVSYLLSKKWSSSNLYVLIGEKNLVHAVTGE